MEQKLREASEIFLERVKKNLPEKKTERPFIIGVIGLISSGKTTTAKMIAEGIDGAVLVRSNSARFLLKERNMKWGENVHYLIFYVAHWLIQNGYGIVFDGDHIEEEKRNNTVKLAEELGAKFFLVRINIEPELAIKRLEKKWAELKEQTFEDYLVGDEPNLKERIPLHEKLDSKDIENLVGEIDNNSSIDELEKRVNIVISKIKESLSH